MEKLTNFVKSTEIGKNRHTNRSLRLIISEIYFFRVFDRNGDGYISKSEFKHCMMHFGEKFTDDEVEEMIAEADANNDGQIDYTEFSQMILKEIDMETNRGKNPKSPTHKKNID